MGERHSAIVDRLIAAQDAVTTLPPITADAPEFSVEDGYRVLEEIERGAAPRAGGRRAQDRLHQPHDLAAVRRVSADVGACVGAHRAVRAEQQGALACASFVQPRIEPEVVFKLKGPLPLSDDPLALLAAAEWIAPGFEIVQSHFPDWKFARARLHGGDCGLHAALVVGAPVEITDSEPRRVAGALPLFELTLLRGNAVIDRGVGANVLGSPALALTHFARLVANQPQFPQPTAGEIITTGTLTDAWPVAAGETWSSDYGELGLKGLTLSSSSRRATEVRHNFNPPGNSAGQVTGIRSEALLTTRRKYIRNADLRLRLAMITHRSGPKAGSLRLCRPPWWPLALHRACLQLRAAGRHTGALRASLRISGCTAGKDEGESQRCGC